MVVWTYSDIYCELVRFINDKVDPLEYLLNFSIIAIHKNLPKFYVRFTLKNVQNNRSHQWAVVINGNTLGDIYQAADVVTTAVKVMLW